MWKTHGKLWKTKQTPDMGDPPVRTATALWILGKKDGFWGEVIPNPTFFIHSFRAGFPQLPPSPIPRADRRSWGFEKVPSQIWGIGREFSTARGKLPASVS